MKENAEIRKSYFLDKYVIIAPKRDRRPGHRNVRFGQALDLAKDCPFCPDKIDPKNIIARINQKKSDDWQVVAIKNIFPAVSLNNQKAFGVQEVIIETPQHHKKNHELKIEEIKLILEMYQRRTEDLARNPKLNYILCLKNSGRAAGASLEHNHSQVFATAIIPKDLEEEEQYVKKYHQQHKSCAYCDIIKKEMGSARKIYADKYFAVFSPYASEYQYEVWIFPRRHLDNISLLSEEELTALSRIMKALFIKLNKLDLDFNYFLHNVVPNKNQHLYIKIQPRASIWAGVELGSGLVVNSISPEEAAKYYKFN